MQSRSDKLFFYTPNEPLSSSYVYFDLNLSEEQKSALEKIKISPQLESKLEYENYGDLDNLFVEIKSFIELLDSTNNEISMIVANLIVDLTKKVLTTMEEESAWVVIRASEPTSAFDFPRWHKDGYYFIPPENAFCKDNEKEGYAFISPKYEQYKIVTTLLGPNTLFFNLPVEEREEFNRLELEKDPEERRKNTGSFIKDIENKKKIEPESAPIGQGTVFIAGSNERAAVHSEPPIHSPRLFVAVAPASQLKVKDRQERQALYQRK